MIIREHDQSYVMIKQHHHAEIAGEIASYLHDSFFGDNSLKSSVQYAISKHDIAWQMTDKQPFWNDQKQKPYSFTDFPHAPKTVFFKHGIDMIEQQDLYAALLCSQHYRQFLLNHPDAELHWFTEHEKERQKKITQQLNNYDEELCQRHFDLLQIFDSLSLFICLNEPGASKANQHPFFKKGIPVPASLTSLFETKRLSIYWLDQQTISMNVFPFDKSLSVTIPQTIVSKQAIAENGLIPSYEQSETEHISIRLTAF